MSAEYRIFSFGGGVQSVAVLALQATGRVNYDAFVFANVGEDSENPDTLTYYRDIAIPFAAAHGIKMVEVARKKRTGEVYTLMDAIKGEARSIVIPARMANGAPGNRNCTEDWKIKQVDKYIRSLKQKWVVVGMGISLDEFTRARDTNWHDHHGKTSLGFNRKREYPLIDQRLTRMDCIRIIGEAGLPVPPKSSCFFCPFKRRSEWIEMKREQPELFAQAVEVERLINAKRVEIGRDGLYLHSSARPLEKAVGDQLSLFEDDSCDGYCHT